MAQFFTQMPQPIILNGKTSEQKCEMLLNKMYRITDLQAKREASKFDWITIVTSQWLLLLRAAPEQPF